MFCEVENNRINALRRVEIKQRKFYNLFFKLQINV